MSRAMRAMAVVLACAAAGMPLVAQVPEFSACYVPSVGAVYLIKRGGLPGACVGAGHVEIGWTGATGGGGGLTSITAGAGLTGGTITTTGTVAVDFAGTGGATTVARSDHTHALSGTGNTGVGEGVLAANATGVNNTAVGQQALNANVDGNLLVAVGYHALFSNTATNNSAVGANALANNSTGSENTALGLGTLSNNLIGNQNTAVGHFAGVGITGNANTAVGRYSLLTASSGGFNTAVGWNALVNATGNSNVAIGQAAGSSVTTGNFNIIIGSTGAATDDHTIRLGDRFQHTKAYMGGVRNVQTDVADASPVVIASDGQLGTISSSRRLKEDIHDMGEASRRLLDLRPVSFRYIKPTSRGDQPLQYGLIAEEVAEAFPELAIVDSTGQAETVRYHILPVLLLNEVQRQAKELAELRRELDSLRAALAARR